MRVGSVGLIADMAVCVPFLKIKKNNYDNLDIAQPRETCPLISASKL